MHVLFIGPFPWPSHQGSQAYLAGQARALAARGHQVSVAVYGGQDGGDLPGVRILRGRAIGRFRGGGWHWSRPVNDMLLAHAIKTLHRSHPIDILHAHNVEGPLIARLTGISVPIVYDLHTLMREELRNHVSSRLSTWAPWIGHLADTLALHTSHAGCAISPRAANILSAAGLLTVEVGPGITLAEFEEPRQPIDLGPGPIIVYTGNLDRYQDLPVLLRAMEGVSARLVVVTGSSDPLPEWVHVIRTPDFRVALDVLAQADLAVIPRTQCAGFPIKLLNQLAMGVPTVMLAGSPNLVGVIPSTPATLHQTLVHQIAHLDALRALGKRAAQAIRAHQTWDHSARRLEALYAALVTPSLRRKTPLDPEPLTPIQTPF